MENERYKVLCYQKLWVVIRDTFHEEYDQLSTLPHANDILWKRENPKGFSATEFEGFLNEARNIASSLNSMYENSKKVEELQKEIEISKSLEDMQQRSANGLYQALLQHLKPYFPENSRDLEWDVLPSSVGILLKRLSQTQKDNEEKNKEQSEQENARKQAYEDAWKQINHLCWQLGAFEEFLAPGETPIQRVLKFISTNALTIFSAECDKDTTTFSNLRDKLIRIDKEKSPTSNIGFLDLLRVYRILLKVTKDVATRYELSFKQNSEQRKNTLDIGHELGQKAREALAEHYSINGEILLSKIPVKSNEQQR